MRVFCAGFFKRGVGLKTAQRRILRVCFILLVLFSPLSVGSGQASSQVVTLEDFQNPDKERFPKGWEGSRSTITAKEAYSLHRQGDATFLKGKGANQRVYTKDIDWNPQTHPVVTWRWRLHAVPEKADFIAALFANLDTDLMFIPISTKYLWSGTKRTGSVTDGGLFGAAEVVIRSGPYPLGEWVEEEVNAYKDFKEIHGHEPAPKAWGISLQSGPGVEIDFDSIKVRAE